LDFVIVGCDFGDVGLYGKDDRWYGVALLLIYHQLSKKLNGEEEQSLLRRLWESEGMARYAWKYFLKARSDKFGFGRAASLVKKKGGVSCNKELG